MLRRIIIGSALLVTVGWGQTHFQPVPATGLPYIIVVSDILLVSAPVDTTTEIGVFDGVLCVGAARVTEQGNAQITAWQSIPTQNLPGFHPNAGMVFKAWAAGSEYSCDASYTVGNGTFGASPYTVTSLTEVITTGVPEKSSVADDIRLNVSSASPFNGSINLKIEMPVYRTGELMIFDVLGRRALQFQTSGTHVFHWNATTTQGTELPSGIYTIVLMSGQQRRTQQVVLVR